MTVMNYPWRHLNVIMVAGCPRSGSTILAHILALAPGTAYAEEPLNRDTGLVGTNEPFVFLDPAEPHDHYDKIIRSLTEGRGKYKPSAFRPADPGRTRQLFYKLFTNRYQLRYTLGMARPVTQTLVSKDPTASLSSEYLHDNFGFKVILTFRHPCGVIASHQRLGWTRGPLEILLGRPNLRRQLSKPAQDLTLKGLSQVERLAWYWRIMNEIIYLQAERHPDMPLVEHETFSLHPEEVVQQLYGRFELKLTPRIRAKVDRLTSGDNPTDPRADRAHTLKRNSKDNIERWRQHLSQQDIDTIMRICGSTYDKLRKLPNNLTV
jgi:hypothetical protein